LKKEILKMKAIVIDPFEQKVFEVDIKNRGDSCCKDIYKHIHCDLFTAVYLDTGTEHTRDVMFVDDEGLYRTPANQAYQAFFQTKWYPDPLAGYGIICGGDEEGETAPCSLTVEEVKEAISGWSLTILEI